MNYKKNLIDSISNWVIENKRVVAGVHDVKKYNIVPLPDGDICIQCTVNGHKYHPRFESLNVNFLKAIWHEIENIRLKETATITKKLLDSAKKRNEELKETLKKGYLECIRHYLKNNNNIKIVIDKVDYSFYLEDDVIVVRDIGADIAIVLEHMSGQFIEIAYRMIGKLDQMAKINFIYEWVMVNGPEVSLMVNIGQERDYRLVRRSGELFIDDGVVENRIDSISSVLIDAIFKLLISYENTHPTVNLVKQKGKEALELNDKINIIRKWTKFNNGELNFVIDSVNFKLYFNDSGDLYVQTGSISWNVELTEKIIINKIYEFWKLHESNIMNRNESFNKINEVSIDDQIRAIIHWVSTRGNSVYVKTDVVTYYIVNSTEATFVNTDGVMFFDIWSVGDHHIKNIYNAIKEMENNSATKANSGSIDTDTNYKELLVNYLQSVRDEVIELNKLEIYVCEESRGVLQEALDLVTELIHVISTNNQKPKKEAVKLVKEKYIDWFTRCKKEIVIGELMCKKFNVEPFTYKSLKELITQNLPGIYGDGNLDRIIEVLEQYNPNDVYKELYEILKG